MNFERLQQISREVLKGAQSEGFDHLTLELIVKNSRGVRVGRSLISRENVSHEESTIVFSGWLNSRFGSFICDVTSSSELLAKIREFRQELALQPIDVELVVPTTAKMTCVWQASKKNLDDLFPVQEVYQALENAISPVRNLGLRVSGYIEISELKKFFVDSAGFELTTVDAGLFGKMTADNPQSGAAGTGEFICLASQNKDFAHKLNQAMDHALKICQLSEGPGIPSAGDYCVILGPRAVRDLLYMTLYYELFDQRKVEERRTYLSGVRDELVFPGGLELSYCMNPEGIVPGYSHAPFNQHGRFFNSLRLIGGGRIQDLCVSPYWAKKTGLNESLLPSNGVPMVLTSNSDLGIDRYETMEQLISKTEHAIYVESLWYIRIVSEMNGLLTGMTRDGVFEVKDGKIIRPLRNMRWHENPFSVLSSAEAITTESKLLGLPRMAGGNGLYVMPSLKIRRFHFSSVSSF
jgi:predicted Zn-dependent protease